MGHSELPDTILEKGPTSEIIKIFLMEYSVETLVTQNTYHRN